MSKIEERLTRQLSAKGVKNAAAVAHEQLVKHGTILPDGTLTPAGEKREALGPAGRAKDRAAKRSGGEHSPADYKYDPKTNRATLK